MRFIFWRWFSLIRLGFWAVVLGIFFVLGLQNNDFYSDESSVFLVFDLGDSMNVKDVVVRWETDKISRLAMAQRLALQLVDQTDGKEIWVVLMKKTGLILLAPTEDRAVLSKYIAGISTALLSWDRSDVSEFLNFFEKIPYAGDQIMLFSDANFDFGKSSFIYGRSDLNWYLVWLGSPYSAQFPFNQKLANNLASLLGGDYQTIDSDDFTFWSYVFSQKNNLMVFLALVWTLFFFFL